MLDKKQNTLAIGVLTPAQTKPWSDLYPVRLAIAPAELDANKMTTVTCYLMFSQLDVQWAESCVRLPEFWQVWPSRGLGRRR